MNEPVFMYLHVQQIIAYSIRLNIIVSKTWQVVSDNFEIKLFA